MELSETTICYMRLNDHDNLCYNNKTYDIPTYQTIYFTKSVGANRWRSLLFTRHINMCITLQPPVPHCLHYFIYIEEDAEP